eukprot:349886-Pelagomonas_calceolata.AAC.1
MVTVLDRSISAATAALFKQCVHGPILDGVGLLCKSEDALQRSGQAVESTELDAESSPLDPQALHFISSSEIIMVINHD